MNKQRGFIFPAASLITFGIYALIALGAAAAIWAAWHKFTEAYRDEGRAQVRAQWAPLIAECERTNGATANSCADAWRAAVRDRATVEANHRACVAKADEQSKAVDEAAARAAQAQDTTRRILAELSKQSRETQSRIDSLKAAAAQPAANEREACNEAKRILADLREVRIKFFTNSPPLAPASGVTIREK